MSTTRRSRSTRIAAVAVVAALGFAACDSQPSAKRVAEDLVNTLAADDPEVRDCMLEKIDGYTKDELEDIGNGAQDGDAESLAALEMFEADLASCR